MHAAQHRARRRFANDTRAIKFTQ